MKKLLIGLVLVSYSSACHQEKTTLEDELSTSPSNAWHALNPLQGYSVDIFGDQVVPIMSGGDTLITGKEFPIKGKILYSDSLEVPINVRAKSPTFRPGLSHIRKLSERKNFIPLNVRTYSEANTGNANAYERVNTIGDTILSGVMLPVKGTMVPCRLSKPVPSKTARVKDNAFYDIQYLDMEEGLSNSQITTVLEDSKGNLWFASYVGGVSRYNGSSFTRFTSRNGLSNDYVTTMMEDKLGAMWFGTHGGGICKYDGVSFMHLTEKEGLPSNFINKIYEDRNGFIWIGSGDKGVSCLKPSEDQLQDSIIHFTPREGLYSLNINDIVEDQKGQIWLASDQKGVIQYNPTTNSKTERFAYYTMSDTLHGNSITCLLEDQQGRLWFGTRSAGVLLYDGVSLQTISKKEGLSGNLIRSLYEDAKGQIWIGTKGAGVDRLANTIITNFSEDNGMTSNIVRSILQDQNGNMWFGTNGGGVCQYRPNSFVHYTSQTGLTTYKTGDIYQDKQNRLWFATSGEGVVCFDNDEDKINPAITQYTMEQGLLRNDITCIADDHKGNKWFGTAGAGACRFDGKTYTYFNTKSGLSGDDIRNILVDDHGNVWFATSNYGVTCYVSSDNGHDSYFVHYTPKEGLPCNFIRTIYLDSHDHLWIGTRGCGLAKLEPSNDGTEGTITYYSTREGFSDHFFNSILEDKSGHLWFGTGRGVNVLSPPYNKQGEELFFIGERRGLASQYVRSLEVDRNGRVWVGTANGLSMITRDTIRNSPFHVVSFYKPQGLKGGEFEFNAALIDNENKAWWGNDKCVEMLDLDFFHLTDSIPTPVLNHIEINGEFMDFRNIPDTQRQNITYSEVAGFENYPLDLDLPFGKNHLTFFFSCNDKAEPSNVRYSYLLEGLENQWSVASPENKAEYRNLPPGTFHFKVRAMDESDHWTEPFNYTFTIHPPWWLSSVAYLFYVVAGLSVLYFIYRFQLFRKLEMEEKKRLVELDSLKNKLYTNITHEFRTPLTLIHGPLSNALSTQSNLEAYEMKSMYQQSKRLQQLITQMLDLQKLEAGKLKPKFKHGDIVVFTRYLCDAIAPLAKEKEIDLQFMASPEEIKLDYDGEKHTQIVTNLLSNAIKYTPRNGKVTIFLKLAESKDYLWMHVRDTGVGIGQEDLPFVFDRYFQSSQAGQGGTGIGLELTKNLIELLGGVIKVESRVNEGTTFIVGLPVHHTALINHTDRPVAQDTHVKMVDDEIRFSVPENTLSDTPIVLIVEDHPEVSMYISQCLSKEYSTQLALDGDEGLQKAFEYIPDLVICDIMMPGKNGFEVCATLKNNIQTSHIPVILLTGRGDQPAMMEGIEKGADAYVVKPFEPQELLLRVRKLLELRTNLSHYYRKNAITDTPEISGNASPVENDFLQKIRAFIEEHLNDSQFNMDMLCHQMAMSHPQLHRKITALTGESTGKFVRSVRLSRAVDLLQKSELTISEIAYETGFSEPGYFTKVFSREFNKTPSEFRSEKH